MNVHFLFCLAILAPYALADVKITTPAAGAKLKGGSTITIAWQDSGNAPSLSDLTNYVVNLCAGGNTQGSFQCSFATLVNGGTFSTGNSITATIPAAVGAVSTNGYFLQIVSTGTGGTQVTNYGSRFSLSDMTGSFTQIVIDGIVAVGTSTSGPDTSNTQVGGSAAVAAGPWATPYTLQTGLTRYAPMQPQPGTKITATNTSPLWPTSAVSKATTWLPIPSIVTTLTQSGTFSVSSRENPAAASTPKDDMAKYLARWRD